MVEYRAIIMDLLENFVFPALNKEESKNQESSRQVWNDQMSSRMSQRSKVRQKDGQSQMNLPTTE